MQAKRLAPNARCLLSIIITEVPLLLSAIDAVLHVQSAHACTLYTIAFCAPMAESKIQALEHSSAAHHSTACIKLAHHSAVMIIIELAHLLT